ncbi:hypothetical protein ISS07_02250 [Candidatus Woesearchaeota archaeon]|nr:hypothetical protein [Candidatus Woesearchaeota archaeon]
MEERFLKTIRKTGTSLGINLPKEVLRLLKLKEEDLVRVTIEKVKNGK